VSSVSYDGDLHCSLLSIVNYNSLETIREFKEVFVCRKALLNKAWRNGYFSSLVLHGRTVKIAPEFLGRKSGHGLVHVPALFEFDGRGTHNVFTLVLGILIDGHRVFEVIF